MDSLWLKFAPLWLMMRAYDPLVFALGSFMFQKTLMILFLKMF